MPETTAVFIDAGYLDKLVQGPLARPGGAPLPLDMRKLPALLARGARPVHVWYYHAMPWVSDPPLPAEHAAFERKAKFVAFLGALPRWHVRTGVIERRGGPRPGDWVYEQKRTDVMLAVDLARLAWRGEIARAVLLAGDSDFVPVVEDARAAGVPTTLWFFPGTAHADLLAACEERFALSAETLAEVVR